MDDLTTTQGIVALAAAGVAVVALLWVIVLAVKLRRVRAAQRTVLGEGQADLVAHAAQIQEAFVQLRDWVEETATRLEERMATAEERIDGCVAYRSLVRYDAYGEMSGQQSSSMALLDAHRTGVVLSSILHREQARVYVKQVREGESELELSPEEHEAIEAALAAAPRLTRVAILGPAGTFSEEALRASAPAGVEPVPYPTIYETVMAVHDGEVDRAVVPIENSLEGAVSATLDTLAFEADRRPDRRRGRPPDPPLPGRRASSSTWPRSKRVISHPQATAQCARFLRERLAGAELVVGALHRGRRAVGAPTRPRATWAPRLPAGGRAVRLPGPGGRRRGPSGQRDAVRLARPGGGGRRSPAARRRSCSGAAATSRPAALVHALQEFADRGVNLTRIESRPRRTSLGHYMFFVDLEGGTDGPRRDRRAGGAARPGGGAARSRVISECKRVAWLN